MALSSFVQAPVANQHKHFNPKQLEILKNSICRGSTNEEFEMFLMACTKTQLDPFMRQIYAVKRRAKKPDGSWGEVMSIQTGIDGYRLIAERTGHYAPGPEPTYTYDPQGKLLSATAYIKKQTRDGTWHTISASAYIDEYCQKTREGSPMGMWATMPRTMLSKCAESQALRKAFPAEMSGVYTKEEMAQADVIECHTAKSPEVADEKMNDLQASELSMILGDCSDAYRMEVYKWIKATCGSESLMEVPVKYFERMKAKATQKMEEYRASQISESQPAEKSEPDFFEDVQ